MAYEEFERRLTEYGLEAKEAKVYVALAWGGPKKASDLATACGQSRMETYRVLKRLQSKGLVEAIISKPMRFVSVHPEKTFDILIRTAREKITILEEEKRVFLQLWSSAPKGPFGAGEEKFRIIWGRVEFFAAVKRMCAGASSCIHILTTRNGLGRLYHAGLDDQIGEKKGIDVKMLAEIDRSNLEIAKKFASISALRHSKPTSTQFVAVDDSEIIVNMALDDSVSLSSKRDTSLWTNSKGYVGLMLRLFDELWADSLEARSVMRSIASGVSLPETRVIHEEEKIAEKEAGMIQSAKRNVIILTSSSRVKKLLKEPFHSALRACKERGAKIRIMTDSEKKRLNDLLVVSQNYNLRLVDFQTSAETVSVDGTESMLIDLDVYPESIAGKTAFWTNEQGSSALMQNFLEQMWNNGYDPHPHLLSSSLTKILDDALKQVGEELSEQGWNISIPGSIGSDSSVKHTFKLVGKRQTEVITVDYLLGTERVGAEPLIAYGAKKTDAKPTRALLLVVPAADEHAIKLAEFFGVDLLQDTDVTRLLAKVRGVLGLRR